MPLSPPFTGVSFVDSHAKKWRPLPQSPTLFQYIALLTIALLTCTLLLLTGCGTTPPSHKHLKAFQKFTPTQLDDYVARVDNSFHWQLIQSKKAQGITTQFVHMSSQTWQPPLPVDKPEWQHWLVINKPDKLKSKTALLYISSGQRDELIPDKAHKNLAQIASRTGAITIELRAIPNQPLSFNNEKIPRKEDDLIAYSWARYLETGNPLWPAQLPMVKSVVRAMDTLQSLHGVKKFVLAGGSKRGWATWLTAAVDTRVEAMIPIVIDVLNVVPSMDHHLAAYGDWSTAIKDYVHHGIMEQRHSPHFASLMSLVDPYAYRERYTQPKYLINASGDQFFLPDSSQFYFDQLPGEKYLRYVPNANHSLKHSDALESMEAYFHSIITKSQRPEFSWEIQGHQIRVTVNDKPGAVKLWQASNPDARDFRLSSIGDSWIATPLSAEAATGFKAGGNTYTSQLQPPTTGWKAFFIELTYEQKGTHPLKFTTPVKVIPDLLPHPTGK